MTKDFHACKQNEVDCVKENQTKERMTIMLVKRYKHCKQKKNNFLKEFVEKNYRNK